jgi:hypothetical protein
MSADSSWPLQQAVYAALAAAPAIQALVGDPPRLYDHVPAATAYPYLTLGETGVADWSNKSFSGAELVLTLHAWSRTRGRQEAKAMLDAAHAVLHRAALSVSGHTLVELAFAGAETLLDEDGLTWHGVARFRALTHTN